MSEHLQGQWPNPEAGFNDHQKYLQHGIDALADILILPEDGRFETAYVLLATGRGQKSSVLAIGDPGTGKTKFGDLLYGDDQRVEISRDDVDDTLYGFTNPIKASEIIPGKLKGLVPENPVANLNEVSHLANTGSLHRLWDLNEIDINGVKVPLRDIAIYMTSNFPDGTPRVHELDEGLRSRIAMEMLTGDYDAHTAAQIQGFNAAKEKDASLAPLLPTAPTRRAMHEMVAERHPVGRAQGEKIGKYLVAVINSLNASGLIYPINSGDARTGEGLYDVARARMIVDERAEGDSVKPREIADVMALTLPRLVRLSRVAKTSLSEEIGGGRRPNPMEQAIAVRRLVARAAFTTLFEDDLMPSKGMAASVDKAVDRYSYANAGAISFDPDRALFGHETVAAEDVANGKRKIFGRRSRNA